MAGVVWLSSIDVNFSLSFGGTSKPKLETNGIPRWSPKCPHFSFENLHCIDLDLIVNDVTKKKKQKQREKHNAIVSALHR